MPNTITTYYTFTPATKARASQVNANFSNYRGSLLPIHESSQTATDMTDSLGAADHRWNYSYVGAIDFKSSTTTAGLIIKGDTTNTTGSFLFQINGVTIQEIKATGKYITSSMMADSARQLVAVTLTGNSTWSIPAGVTRAWAHVFPGGGGGGAGGGSGAGSSKYAGGAGGNGNSDMLVLLDLTASTILSIACGLGGSGGAGGGSDGAPGNSGSSTFIYGTGFSLCVYGAAGGLGGAATTTPGAVGGTDSCVPLSYQVGGGYGGKGITTSSGATDGNRNLKWLGGLKGTDGATLSGAGGGGGAGYNGPGGAGADGISNTNGNSGNSAPAYASGGGGGGGSAGNSTNGGKGGNAGPGIVIIYYLY